MSEQWLQSTLQYSPAKTLEPRTMVNKNSPLSASTPEEFWKQPYGSGVEITPIAASDPEKGLRNISTARTQIVLLVVAYALLSLLLLSMGTM